MASNTVKTRLLIISDSHCASLRGESNGNLARPPFEAPLPAADVLIHCGDLTYVGREQEYHGTLDMLRQIDAPVKLVIPGNHDLTLDEEFVVNHIDESAGTIDRRLGGFLPDSKQGVTRKEGVERSQQMRDLWLAQDGRARREGITFLDEGTHLIKLLNGARINVYASPYTPEFVDWGFPYLKHEDRFNPPSKSLADADNITAHPIPGFSDIQPSIDIMITHGPPYGRLDETSRGDKAGCPHLLRALMRARPLIHCFGHIHEGWGAECLKWSPNADEVVANSCSIREWKDDGSLQGFKDGEKGIEAENFDLNDVKKRHGAFLDLSNANGRGIKRGEESVVINAAIMDVRYKPVNAAWVVDLDLPKDG